MSDLRPDGTPYPADEDSPFGRWLSVYLTRIGACHDGYFDCANLKDAYLAGMDGDCGGQICVNR